MSEREAVTSNQSLLPCPFCGSSAEFRDGDQHGQYWGQWVRVLWCSSSHCRARMELPTELHNVNERLIERWNSRRVPVETSGVTAADYEEVLASHRRLVRELDVLLNGDGAAQQASLCDVVAQLASIKRSCPITWSHLQDALRHEEQCAPQNGEDKRG